MTPLFEGVASDGRAGCAYNRLCLPEGEHRHDGCWPWNQWQV